MEIKTTLQNSNNSEYITDKDVEYILSKHGKTFDGCIVDNYSVRNASDNMLGFLCDYWKLTVHLRPLKKALQYFLKVVSVSNAAKAEMVEELKLFEKELYFYAVIKKSIEVTDFKPWSAGFVTDLRNAMVFEDMNALQYKLRDKFKRFDMAHTLEALKTLARFHASSIVFEERKSKKLGRTYSVNEDFGKQLGRAGYVHTNIWFLQCMDAALKAIKQFSKYSAWEIRTIENSWFNVWCSGLELSDPSTKYRNVICHRDLWNNNLMFHYKKVEGEFVPDDCVLVDFQAARYQPPAGDVMLLLYCNLDPMIREDNMYRFLNFYLDELCNNLTEYGIEPSAFNREMFFESAEQQRQWAVVVSACLMPQFWIDDDLTTRTFCDTEQFNDVLTKNKAAFVIKMMKSNSDYKEKVMSVYQEIVERYCL